MRQYHWMILWNTASLCLNIGQRMIFASSFRKMLTIEQFRSEEMQNLYQQYLVSGPAGYVKDLFKNMKIKDPEENAVKFYANMFFYYSLYDGAADKAKAKCQFEQMLDKIVEEMKQ